MSDPIRVLIVDDHPVVREGLASLVAIQPDMEVVGEAANGEEAVAKARTVQPDVVVLDLVLPRKSGVQAAEEILAGLPETRVLVLTSYAENSHIFPAIWAGALGYLLKDAPPQQLLEAIRTVYQGRPYLDHRVAMRLMRNVRQPSDPPRAEEPLTEREVEVLKLVAQGLSNHEIGEILAISERTVGSHVSHILSKLDLESRTQAVLYALRMGLVSLNSDLNVDQT